MVVIATLTLGMPLKLPLRLSAYVTLLSASAFRQPLEGWLRQCDLEPSLHHQSMIYAAATPLLGVERPADAPLSAAASTRARQSIASSRHAARNFE